MSKPLVTAEQQAHIRNALAELRTAFPDKSDNQIADLFVAETVTLPSYSTLRHALVTTVSSVMVGAATLCYGNHPDSGEPSIVLIRRSEIGAEGEYQYGTIGGFINPGYYALEQHGVTPHYGEQPQDGAIRENAEELLNNEGKPILQIDRSRLVIIGDGIDEHSLAKGHLATHYTSYAVELNEDEMKGVLKHSRSMHEDATYRQAVTDYSHGEITNVEVLSLKEAADLRLEQFTHPHELHAVRILYDLTKPQHSDPRSTLIQHALTVRRGACL